MRNMNQDPWELPSVREALLAVFGTARATQAQAISGGASGASIYRVQAGERVALLRVDRARDAFRDPRRAYTCMRVAADAGVAPALHYADPEAGVAIMDFVPCLALRDYPGGERALVRALGQLI